MIAHGIDLVEIARVEGQLERHGERFRDRVFTPGEQEWADAGGKMRGSRYAGRFAVKEAASKVLRTGIGSGITWLDFETTAAAGGAPQLTLSGKAAELAAERGLVQWEVSISHTAGLVIASVIAVEMK